MPQSIPAGITSEHILAALAELDRGVEHGFGRATKFQLVDSGRSYDPKAVIGLAVRHLRAAAVRHTMHKKELPHSCNPNAATVITIAFPGRRPTSTSYT